MRRRIVLSRIAIGLLLVFGGCASESSRRMDAANKILVANVIKSTMEKIEKEQAEQYLPVPHDNSVKWQIAAMILKRNDINDLRLVAPGRLLLSVGSGGARTPRLIDTNDGSTVWAREIVKNDPSISGERETVTVSYVTVHRDMILFRADGSKGSKLLAVETATGNKRWDVGLKKSGELHVIPFPAAEILLAVQQGKRAAVLTAFNLSTGAAAWKSETGYGGGTAEPPAPTVDDDAVFTYYDGVTRLAAANGKMEWRRAEILAGRQSPPMQLENGRLVLIDGENTLHVLDARTGRRLVSGKQRDGVAYTNLYPLGDRVYLRGVEKGKTGEPRFFVAAVRGADGAELWVDSDKDPSVSNLIDEDGRLFFSTPFTVVAVDRETGKRRFAARASDIGKSFPVRIAKYGGRVVYIGELVVAAFDAKTGAKVYRHGFDPVNQTAHMDALNNSIESKTEYLSWFTGPLSGWDLSGANMSNFFFQQATYSQNQSTYQEQLGSKYAWEANTTRSGSAAQRSDIHYMNATIDAAAARAQQSMGMAFMTVENMQRGIAQATAADRAKLEELLRIRKLLYAAYVGTQQGDYVYRPTNESGIVGISVIHLPSGRMKHTPLTPEHREVGIFSLVDFEKGIVYHPGVKITGGETKAYFMARPVAIPK